MISNSHQNPNIEILISAARQLGELTNEMVFLGGCATGLLITDLAASPIRITQDVDAVIQATTHSEYYHFSKKLRSQGFSEDTREDAPICRWIGDGVTLDVMPMNSDILGFGNEWYIPAISNAKHIRLSDTLEIKMVTAPYFLITKLTAFDGRGEGDYLLSHDIEDIIAVLDGRPEILEEARQADQKLRTELAIRFKCLLKDRRFIEAIAGHLPPDNISQARCQYILSIMKNISEAL